jgi:neurotransmitter:Na+ symporter, NSS family
VKSNTNTHSQPKTGKQRDLFSNKFGVVMAAAGSAIGLGNIWRFPYLAGNYGGAAFILVYLAFNVLIALPILISEFSIGRKARSNVHAAFAKLAPHSHWYIIGYMGIAASFTILSFYGVVAGWSIEYIISALNKDFAGKTPEQLRMMFYNFSYSPLKPILWQIIFMSFTCAVIIRGIKNGIEKFNKILMPLLLVIIVILDIRAISLPGASEGLAFLLKPDFSKLTSEAILAALGQSFFSMSIGMGAMITYGSYIKSDDNLTSSAIDVAFTDIIIAILAGIAIIPAVFAFGLQPGEGPGLVYITLPNVFQQMPGGYIFSILFFLLLLIAALTSSISILEVQVAYFVEELKLKRKAAAILGTCLATLTGIICSLSLSNKYFNINFFGKNFFELMDYISSNLLLPLGGLFIALFIGWFYSKHKLIKELSSNGKYTLPFFRIFMFLLKFIAPIAILIVFLQGIGLL